MPDLREHLKKIEAAEPPHLWAGIEARAREEGPQMDTNITSIAAFRTPGWEGRRRLAAGLVAAAVVALVAVVAWRSFQPATTKLPIGTDVPPGWERCTNEALGYSIGYPGAWHTTDVFDGEQDPANACRWFSPQPFGAEGNVVAEGWGYPLEVAAGGPFDREVRQTLDPEVARTVVEEDLLVDGHRAVRLEYETLVDLIADTGLHYQYVIEIDPKTTLIVHTTETRGIEGDYQDNRTVVDQAVETLRFTSAGS
jgi:hypothetical protein